MSIIEDNHSIIRSLGVQHIYNHNSHKTVSLDIRDKAGALPLPHHGDANA